MPDKVKEFQRIGAYYGIVTSDYGIVTGHYGKTPRIGHDKTK